MSSSSSTFALVAVRKKEKVKKNKNNVIKCIGISIRKTARKINNIPVPL